MQCNPLFRLYILSFFISKPLNKLIKIASLSLSLSLFFSLSLFSLSSRLSLSSLSLSLSLSLHCALGVVSRSSPGLPRRLSDLEDGRCPLARQAYSTPHCDQCRFSLLYTVSAVFFVLNDCSMCVKSELFSV